MSDKNVFSQLVYDSLYLSCYLFENSHFSFIALVVTFVNYRASFMSHHYTLEFISKWYFWCDHMWPCLFTETFRNRNVGILKSHQACISHAGLSPWWHGLLFSPHSLSLSDLLSTTLHISHQLVVSSDTFQVSYLFWQLCVWYI